VVGLVLVGGAVGGRVGSSSWAVGLEVVAVRERGGE